MTQTVAQQSIYVTIPSAQTVYFTFEIENPRLSKNCKTIDEFVNIYFFKGKNFPGTDKLIGKLGYMGGSMYHATLAMPDHVLEEGTYTMLIADWELEKNGPLHYTLSVYQEGTGDIGL